jgi:Holliday junction resolvasome RuvABC ATP-dependent DNA helicase subunit
MDNKILNTIIDKFKGVQLAVYATAVSESTETIEVYEPFLIQEGFI